MLLVLAAIVFAVWLLLLAFKVTLGVAHLLLVVAVALFIAGLFSRRTPAPPDQRII